MSFLSKNPAAALQELRALVIENAFLRVVLFPEAGAKVRQIHYKPLATDLLWNDPQMPLVLRSLYSSYDDAWSGGWDELFPNDEAGTVMGQDFPDHGELWTGDWQATPFETEDAVGVHLQFTTPISRFLCEKTLILPRQSTFLKVEYRLTNQGPASFPFLWKLHPAFAVSSRHRIDFPPMTVLREPEFAGTLDGAPRSFKWPNAVIGREVIDLRQVPDVSSHAVHFFYGTELAAGWCGITDRGNKLAAALRFDPEVFTSCWLFATHGGWHDLNVAVLEPATGYPFQMQSMIDAGRARWLAPGETLQTTVLFSVQEGLKSIGGVDEFGRILPGDE